MMGLVVDGLIGQVSFESRYRQPADLTVHTAPGVHPSVMPAFRDQLTDEERWHVVNYIRTLGQ